MPLTSPLPAELAFGQPTRESLSGTFDDLSLHKDQAEREWVELLLRFWRGQLARLEARLRTRLPNESPGKALKAKLSAAVIPQEFWTQESKAALALITPQVAKGATTAAKVTTAQLEGIGISLDWTLVNTEAAAWARKYAGKLVKGIDKTTRKAVGEAVGTWVETPGATMGELFGTIKDMAYPERRARLIAVTEVTRSFTEGSIITARQGEKWRTWPDLQPLFRYWKTWQTNNDGVVCDACREMHGEEVETTKGEFITAAGVVQGPPLHPGCRCWPTFRVEAITKEEAKEGWEKAKLAAKEKKKKKAETEKQKAERLAKQKKEAAEKKKQEAAERERVREMEAGAAGWKPGQPFTQTHAMVESLHGERIMFDANAKWMNGANLNGVPLSEAVGISPDDWLHVADRAITEPLMPTGKLSSGVVMVEPDGRVWLVEPSGHYGGYEFTYPKGGLKGKLTAQQNALKEVYEESGLLAEIDGCLGDYVSPQTGGTTRYYYGRRIGGAPWAFQKESQAVYLATLEEAETMLNVSRDLEVLGKLRSTLGVVVEEVIEEVAPIIAPAVQVPAGKMPRKLPAGAFPDEVSNLEHVRGLGGSTGATLVRDPATGRLYVMKKGASAAHIRSECLADDLYRRMGVKVPAYQLYETAAGPVKLAEYIPEARDLQTVLNSGNKQLIRKVTKKMEADFAADAFLGNWDVLGMGLDNILVDAKGVVWRVDNGGALFYRAQGALKEAGTFDQWMTELWSMRAAGRDAARVFGETRWWDIAKQLETLGGLPEAKLLAGVPDDMAAILRGRLTTVRDLWYTTTKLKADKWVEGYVDGFCKHSVGLRKSGLLTRLPKEIRHRGGESVQLYDEKGRLWDKLRGYDGVSKWIEEYINSNGGNYRAVQQWAASQSGSSWRGTPQAVKYMLAEMRGGNFDDYFWREGLATAQKHYSDKIAKFGAESFRDTFQMWHAFNYEFVRYTPFPNNNLAEGYLMLMRTDPASALKRSGATRGEINYMTRGVNESGSIYKTVTVGGHDLTLQLVPHHRVTGNYFFERAGEGQMFLGDSENEFTFISEGLPFYYYGTVRGGASSGRYWSKKVIDMLLRELFK